MSYVYPGDASKNPTPIGATAAYPDSPGLWENWEGAWVYQGAGGSANQTGADTWGGGGEESGGSGSELSGIDLGDIEGAWSYAGPPDWFDTEAKSAWDTYFPQFMDELSSTISEVKNGNSYDQDVQTAWDDYKNNFGQAVEDVRTLLPKQFLAGLAPMEELYQPALESMSARGMLPSNVTSDALGDITKDIQRQYGEVLAGANTNAAQTLLSDLQQRPQLAQALSDAQLKRSELAGTLATSGQGLLNQIINLDRYSESQNDGSIWGPILSYLLGGV